MDISHSYIDLLQKGDRKSFERLYDNYAPNLLGVVCQMLHEKPMAEDVLQESFIKIYKNIESYDPEKGGLFTWMLNICRNSAIDRKRKINREREKVNRFESTDVSTNEAPELWIEDTTIAEKRKNLNEALEELPQEQKIVIKNLYFDGLTQRELAKTKDIPLGTIKSRVRLGMKKLRESLKIQLLWM
ncbi:MAG TPA: sigma-70 family RNA polymerase sigma factor [Saprospiraceae bacterium]|nr:sigma-70 family RNA polymerase sigma factor [Saprospiraceae bacterium]